MPHIGYFPTVGFPKPFSVGPSGFVADRASYDWWNTGAYLNNQVVLSFQDFSCPIILPQGVTITKITLYGYRTSAGAVLKLLLLRNNRQGNSSTMAQVVADWTNGVGSGYDDSIDNPVVDNQNYDYCLCVHLDPDAAITDSRFAGAKVDWS